MQTKIPQQSGKTSRVSSFTNADKNNSKIVFNFSSPLPFQTTQTNVEHLRVQKIPSRSRRSFSPFQNLQGIQSPDLSPIEFNLTSTNESQKPIRKNLTTSAISPINDSIITLMKPPMTIQTNHKYESPNNLVKIIIL